jgi:hypothetical protein
MPPARQRCFGPSPPFLTDRKPHPCRDLLGAQKIFTRGVFKAAAVERHQALITAHIRALVDGHGEMTLAEQRPGILSLLEPPLVEARVGAQTIRRLKVDNQERHRAIGLGLQDEAALEFQGRAKQGREHDRFAKQLADGGRIIVLGQDIVERRADPGQPSAQIERVDLERQHGVVDRNR